MYLTKRKLFFLLNGAIAFLLLLYSLLWMLSPTTTGVILSRYAPTTLTISYRVQEKDYTTSCLRNDVPYGKRNVELRYLSFDPSRSRINSFMGILAEPMAWWFVFFLASAMLLLTNNLVFSKGTRFLFQRRFPWISMEEYFPHEPEELPSQEVPRTARRRIRFLRR